MASQQLKYTPIDDIPKIREDLKKGFKSGKLKSIAYRKYQLLQLAYLVKDNAKRFEDALKSDLNRPAFEAHFLEIATSVNDVKDIWGKVEAWAKPEKPSFNLTWTPMRPVIYKEPKGVVLMISPFNYPLWLTISPLASAIAAGCAVLIKPSESAPAVSSLYAELIPQYLDSDLVRVVNGGAAESTKLLELQWDHILFTGSGRVGKIVATAAAKHLTPVTLELGGKSPVIIDPNCDLEMAARRILWGKVINAGQTCEAPDYILVPRFFQDKLVAALNKAYRSFYPEHAKPSERDAYSRIITPQAYARIKNLLDNTNGEVTIGGETDDSQKFIAPTVIKNVKADDPLMSEEIFGPLLPIVPVDDLDAAIEFINARDHPLAIYVFSQDAEFKRKVFESTQSGAAVANEVVIHTAAPGMPLEGFGPSGYGAQTGKYGFDAFTHLRCSLDSPSWIDKVLAFRFPPYTKKSIKAALKFYPSLPTRPTGPPLPSSSRRGWSKWFLYGLVLMVLGSYAKKGRIMRTIA